MNVNNRRVVSDLAHLSYKANKKRNLLTIFAIILTTFLITAVLSIGLSYWNTITVRQLRMYGMDYDISLSEPSEKQEEMIRSMDEVKHVGLSVKCAIANEYQEKNLIKIPLHWLDKNAWNLQCVPALDTVEGNYPSEENEIMLSAGALKIMGIENPSLGMKLPLKYFVLAENANQEQLEKEFVLSGYFLDYSGKDKGYVSQKFYRGTGAKQTDHTQGKLLISLKNKLFTQQDIVAIQDKIGLETGQYIDGDSDTISNFIKLILVLLGMLILILMSGFLFIYNTLYISISKDIRYYGQLKTIGMTSKQLKGLVLKTTLWNSLAGIPLGIILGFLITKNIIPALIHAVDPILQVTDIVTVQPWYCILAGSFSFAANMTASRKPANIAGCCSPVEAIRYIPRQEKHKSRKSDGSGIVSMAWRNMFRDKKQAVIILSAFTIAVSIFIIVNVIIKANNAHSILNEIYTYDIRFQNDTTLFEKLPVITDETAANLKKIPGVKWVDTVSSAEAIVPYQEEVLGEYYRLLFESRFRPGGDYQESIDSYKENPNQPYYTTRFIGIGSKEFERLNKSLNGVLDRESFEKGLTAVAINSFEFQSPSLVDKDIHFFLPDGINPQKEHSIHIAAVGTSLNRPVYYSGGYTPPLLVSNNLAKKLLGKVFIENISVKYEEPFSASTEKLVTDFFAGEESLSYNSKLERYDEMYQSELQVTVLGSSLAIIIALLAVLNYINMMAAGVQNRSKEFATLESIGMSRKQLRKVLALEGLGYSIISVFLSLLAGIPLSYAVMENIKVYNIPYSLPLVSTLVLFACIILLCALVPIFIYMAAQKQSVIERLREMND